jgi:hypothetical protein
MPAGDYYNCVRCGKTTLGAVSLCNDCHLNNAYGISFDVYGKMTNTYVNLSKKQEDLFKEDARSNINTLASVMGERPLNDKEFEEFWQTYNTNRFMNNIKETLNDVYNEVIAGNLKQENSYSKCNKCDPDCDEDISAEDIDGILAELELEPENKETVSEAFDKLFSSEPSVKKIEVKSLKRKTLVVNLFAGPGSGKSTTAAGVFFELKSRGINCEIASEFVKDLVWESRHKAINNQVYIFAKQHHRITRLLDEVSVIITDSPLLLTLVYGKENDEILKRLAKHEHNKLWSLNCFIKRNKEYNPKGRIQTYSEARELDNSIANMLDDENISYEVYFGNADGKDKIVNKILHILGEK